MGDLLARAALAEPLVELVAVPRIVPRLHLDGPGPLADGVRARAAVLRESLRAGGRRIDPHGVVHDDSGVPADTPSLRLWTYDYAEVSALREQDGSVAVLNAMGVLVAPERRALVLHRRARTAQFHPGALQGVGGSYAPPDGRRRGDGDDLTRTMRREVCEELGLDVSLADTRLLLLREHDVGSYLLVFAGCIVTGGLQDPEVDRDEGDMCIVAFDELHRLLTDPARVWAPSGRVSVLCWLALGAPGAGREARFGGLRTEELLGRILAQ